LSTCHQVRHEATSTFYKHCGFTVTPVNLDQFKHNNDAPDSKPWEAIQNIEMLDVDVDSRILWAEITGIEDYVGVLPALRRVQVRDNHWDLVIIDDDVLANMLGTAFGRQGLEVSILFK
jgi:hypothetical protein